MSSDNKIINIYNNSSTQRIMVKTTLRSDRSWSCCRDCVASTKNCRRNLRYEILRRVLHIRNHFIRYWDTQFLRKQWLTKNAIVLKQKFRFETLLYCLVNPVGYIRHPHSCYKAGFPLMLFAFRQRIFFRKEQAQSGETNRTARKNLSICSHLKFKYFSKTYQIFVAIS